MTKDEEIRALKAAFEEFSQTSQILTNSYHELQNQVAELAQKLAQSEQEKQDEVRKNEMLLAQFQQLFQSMPVGVLMLNSNGLVIMANKVAIKLFDVELVGHAWGKIVPQSFAPQKDDGHEVTMVSGRRVRVETSSLGNVPGQLIILIDLTETFKLQQQLSHHERLSNMGKMVAALAHQIRTPLASATLYAGHLQNQDLSQPMRQKFADKLMGRLENIERQIRDMLIFSKSDIRLDQKVSAQDFFIELSSLSQDICEQKITEFEAENLLDKDVLIQCNKDTLIGALLNLLNNGIDAQDKNPRIKLEVALENDHVSITYVDFGPGMTNDELEKVHEGFVTTKQHGTGLGLMVVKAVARAHHGLLEINSVKNYGTRAQVLIPIIKG
ncbi:two-component sensor [Marinomonas sp. MED121]|uniref:sensor histidine kinase n=1 Tax=Marinomonas sp. MED121 TaxID=314277 RepID=UPI00006903F8|nr:ATP-binding protein [Marinomonas sp. MED121]EAQ66234.1 two-component sensor [Marinomonas sp. MED121]